MRLLRWTIGIKCPRENCGECISCYGERGDQKVLLFRANLKNFGPTRRILCSQNCKPVDDVSRGHIIPLT
jgi:hypothetical protein